MDDVDIRGITTAIARTGKYDLSSCNNLLARKGAKIIKKIIKKKLITIEVAIKEDIKFLLFFLSSATILDKAIGRPNCPRPINKEKVGKTSIYRPIPSLPINLLITIFIIIPSILVRKPPIIKIIVDLINVSFFIKPPCK